ncbi:hypothetical protein JOQ06_022757, partial [Pogonophryne albipinna]
MTLPVERSHQNNRGPPGVSRGPGGGAPPLGGNNRGLWKQSGLDAAAGKQPVLTLRARIEKKGGENHGGEEDDGAKEFMVGEKESPKLQLSSAGLRDCSQISASQPQQLISACAGFKSALKVGLRRDIAMSFREFQENVAYHQHFASSVSRLPALSDASHTIEYEKINKVTTTGSQGMGEGDFQEKKEKESFQNMQRGLPPDTVIWGIVQIPSLPELSKEGNTSTWISVGQVRTEMGRKCLHELHFNGLKQAPVS